LWISRTAQFLRIADHSSVTGNVELTRQMVGSREGDAKVISVVRGKAGLSGAVVGMVPGTR
jgi:hypothetical protein